MGALKIPEELLDQASQIPGLGERVVRYIRLELAQHEMRNKRFSAGALGVVERACKRADEIRAAGYDRDAIASDFEHQIDTLRK